MNRTITIYELLGLVKDGKQPKHIKYRGEEWWWGYDTYTYFSCLEKTPDAQISMFTKYVINYCLDDEVEIIEDNDKLEKIKLDEEHCRLYKNNEEWWAIKRHQLFIYKEINKIIDHVNKIEEKLDEK